jgi:hypothetical protein
MAVFLCSQKQPINRVVRFFRIRIPERLQELVKGFVVFGGHLQAHQYAAVVGALVAVVKQADVPARAHQAQELEQGAWPLGELKAQQAFVL